MAYQVLEQKIVKGDMGWTYEVSLLRFDEYSPYKWGVEIKNKQFGTLVDVDDLGYKTRKAAKESFDRFI